jgi:hypothetical protein
LANQIQDVSKRIENEVAGFLDNDKIKKIRIIFKIIKRFSYQNLNISNQR